MNKQHVGLDSHKLIYEWKEAIYESIKEKKWLHLSDSYDRRIEDEEEKKWRPGGRCLTCWRGGG